MKFSYFASHISYCSCVARVRTIVSLVMVPDTFFFVFIIGAGVAPPKTNRKEKDRVIL